MLLKPRQIVNCYVLPNFFILQFQQSDVTIKHLSFKITVYMLLYIYYLCSQHTQILLVLFKVNSITYFKQTFLKTLINNYLALRIITDLSQTLKTYYEAET